MTDLKRNYYSGFTGFGRLACEVLFCCLLIFYVTMEVMEISVEIQKKASEAKKEDDPEEEKEK